VLYRYGSATTIGIYRSAANLPEPGRRKVIVQLFFSRLFWRLKEGKPNKLSFLNTVLSQ
jgi:hypothetical protein